MFLRKNHNYKTGRTYLSIVRGYQDKNGVSRHKTVQKVGYLDELEKTMEDPVAYYTELAKKLEQEYSAESALSVTVNADERLSPNKSDLKNFGYIALSKIYHELELDRFFNNMRRHTGFKFNSESIMRLLAYARVIYPDSKRATLELKDRFFEHFDFSLDDIYDCLTHFGKVARKAQLHIHNKICEQYGRNTSLIYYDVTNYYFQTDKSDEYRKKGYSKENRKKPIIQMGMAIDANGIPMAYRTYPGGTSDCETYIPALTDIKAEFKCGRAVVVADKGLNCGDNIVFSSALGDGYIFSQSILGGSDEFKAYVLDEKGYTKPTKEGFKCKSRVLPVGAKITAGVTKTGRKSKKTVMLEAQKQVVFYSPKYAARAKRKREETLQKAAELINDPSKYSRATHYGAAAYVENFQVDKKTGEAVEIQKNLTINTAKVIEEEKYDGYYAIISSEADDTDERIIDIYRGLWRIEETFKVTKTVLRTRPVFVYRKDHIDGHFLVCFIALMLLRLVELRLDHEFCAERITGTLRAVTCTHMCENQYVFNYADEVTEAILEKLGIDMGLKYMTAGSIRKAIAETKKHRQGG